MLALGWGRVLEVDGSRDRDISWMGINGASAHQGELYVQYDIGGSSIYHESFVAYYAHLRRRSVVDGQTVAPGQILGYSGTSGSSSGPTPTPERLTAVLAQVHKTVAAEDDDLDLDPALAACVQLGLAGPRDLHRDHIRPSAGRPHGSALALWQRTKIAGTTL